MTTKQEAAAKQRQGVVRGLFTRLANELDAAQHQTLATDVRRLRERYEHAGRDAAATDAATTEEAAPAGFRWRKHDRKIAKGDILRRRIDDKDHPNYGLYEYAVAVGSGGGCDPESPRTSNKVWVHSPTGNLTRAFANRGRETKVEDEVCWSSYWGLGIIEGTSRMENTS